jgi:hypothetical protein
MQYTKLSIGLSISIGILLILGSIGVIKKASALDHPAVTQEQGSIVTEATHEVIGIGVNEEGNGKVVGMGFGTDGRDGTGNGGIVGIGLGGEGEDGEDGGNGTGNGGIVGIGLGGEGG